jgi:hypothetical protein
MIRPTVGSANRRSNCIFEVSQSAHLDGLVVCRDFFLLHRSGTPPDGLRSSGGRTTAMASLASDRSGGDDGDRVLGIGTVLDLVGLGCYASDSWRPGSSRPRARARRQRRGKVAALRVGNGDDRRGRRGHGPCYATEDAKFAPDDTTTRRTNPISACSSSYTRAWAVTASTELGTSADATAAALLHCGRRPILLDMHRTVKGTRDEDHCM